MLTSDQARQLEGRPAPHAHTWGRRGSTCTQAKGRTISAIARHLGRDRKTVGAYINEERVIAFIKDSTAERRRSVGPTPAACSWPRITMIYARNY